MLELQGREVAEGGGADAQLGVVEVLAADADLDCVHGLVHVRAEAEDVELGVAEFGAVHNAQAAPGQVAGQRVLGFLLEVAVAAGAFPGLECVLGHHPVLLLVGNFRVAVFGAGHLEGTHQPFGGFGVRDIGLLGLALVAHGAVVHDELAVVLVVPCFTEQQGPLVVALVDPDNSAHARPLINQVVSVPSKGAFWPLTARNRESHSACMARTSVSGYSMRSRCSANSSSSSTNTPRFTERMTSRSMSMTWNSVTPGLIRRHSWPVARST